VNIQTILSQIDLGAIALPEFQRGYVWNRDQVRGLMDSLYRRHPVGGLLVWETKTENATARGDGQLAAGTVKLLLDGQQRITSLYGIIRGTPPKFFDGNAQAFTDLYFNLEDETFEFYGPVKMRDSLLWIDVTRVMQDGVGATIGKLFANPDLAPKMDTYIGRVTAVDNIKNINLHIEEVSGEDKTVDVVVDIFNKVNSGGTKLSKGDLALAKICAEWPDARDEMKARLEKWRNAGFHFRLEWLLRCINSIVTGEALFSALANVTPAEVQHGLSQAEKSVDTLLNLISSRLGLDHDRVLGSRYSFPLLAHYLVRRGGRLADYREQDTMLYWYVHTFLWGRYAGSTETVLNQDLALIEDLDGGLDRLIGQLRQNRGDLRIRPNDFLGWSRGARFYPLLYMLTRVYHARDWESGVELSNSLLGRLSSLQMHHIFPRALLYKHGYTMSEVNALANFTFLTQETNLLVSDQDPAQYLAKYATKHPGAVGSHWIPMEPDLWKIENYREFLAARRELLAKAANDFLEGLLAGSVPEVQVTTPVLERAAATVPGTIAGEDEEQLILECAEWVTMQGLPDGEIMYELTDPDTGEPLAVFDLAWPYGLQEGLSQPVVLLLNEVEETEQVANEAGYRYFTSVDAFREYVLREILATPEDLAAD
jgi:hypothetical protein